jgi:hypothetical protein
MGILYSDFNKRENIMEPNLQRHRLVYKGPISSSVLNLCNDQFLLDINRLKSKIDELNASMDTISEMTGNDLYAATPDYYLNEDLKMTIYTQSISYDKTAEEYVIEQSTPYENADIIFQKYQINSAKISWLMNKLDLIEAAMQEDI